LIIISDPSLKLIFGVNSNGFSEGDSGVQGNTILASMIDISLSFIKL
jgi:hypothetical protein